MPKTTIDDAYLCRFFNLGNDAAGHAECAAIRKKFERLTFSHGEDIIRIDEEPDAMYFLESGTCAVLGRDGDQINLMQEGQYFGEYGVLSGERRLSTVRSVGRSVVYRLSGADMIEILGRHPGLYGDLMKQVYGQVSQKHAQLLTLSRMRRGILLAPDSDVPLPPRKMLVQYGALALFFALALLLIPKGSAGPVFLVPLGLMVVYVLYTKRTLESLIVSGMLAAVLFIRSGLAVSYTDALSETMIDPGNVFTVLVMALMGGVITLIEASGAVTALKKIADRKVRSPRGALFASIGTLAVTAIDDCLNMLCSATTVRSAADEQKIPREKTALLLSILPTAICSFLPFSLWGIFVVATLSASVPDSGASLLWKSVPFNFYSIVSLAGLILLSLGKLPASKPLREAEERVSAGGKLWPAGSESHFPPDDPEIWGLPRNLLVPVAVLAVTSLATRSIWSGSFVLDSAVGLVATLIVLFFLYCGQGLMSPQQFADHLISGIQSMVLPIVLYLLAMCFASLLSHESLDSFFRTIMAFLEPFTAIVPAMLFLLFMLLTVALGSSWAMYVIGFPVAVQMATLGGLSLPLCVGAIAAAGIAGEKNCIFTSDALSVGSAVGCDPKAVLSVRLSYSLLFTAVSFVFYLIAGIAFRFAGR